MPVNAANGALLASPYSLSRRRAFAAIFCILALWPYEVAPVFLTAGVSAGVAISALVLGAPVVGIAWGAFWAFSGWVVFASLASLRPDMNVGLYISQVNHFWQFILLYCGLFYIFREDDWIIVLKSRKIIFLLFSIFLVTTLYSFVAQGDYINDFNMSIVFIMTYFLVLDKEEKKKNIYFFLIFVGLCAIVYSRMTNVVCLIIFIYFYFRNLSGPIVRIIALLLVFGPATIYLFANDNLMYDMLDLDFNTFIRAEFLKGAIGQLMQNPIFGVGFDHPYRDAFFYYLADHPLLTNVDQVNHISNHHSIFDTTLRLGIIGSGLLCYITFFRPDVSKIYPYKAFLMIMLGAGLGINAWLEDQRTMAQVAVIVSILNTSAYSIYRTRKTSVRA